MTGSHFLGDGAFAHAAQRFTARSRPRLVLVTSILASSLAFVDGSVVNVGLPAIGADLGGGAADLQWVINAYLLPLTALLLLGGALGDRFGRRRLLITGVILFAAGSGLCAWSGALPALLAGRAAQGAGAALLLPNSLALLGGAFTGEAKGRAVGAWAAASAMTGALGPVLGGWLIDTVGWRAIFLINLPLAAGAVALALLAGPEARGRDKPVPLDLAGAVLATAALGALVWGLTIGAGPRGWTPSALASVAGGAGLAAAFVWTEIRRGDRAMTPPALFGSRTFVSLNLMTFLLYGALGAFMLLVPFVLIERAGYAATAAGAALLPFPIVMAIGGPVMGSLAGRFGSRAPLAAGAAIVAVGFLAALRIVGDGPYWSQVLPCILVMAFGMAGVAAPLTTAVLSSADSRHVGSASGLNSAVARGGGLVATALLGAVLAARGEALAYAFRIAALVAAATALTAGVIAFLGLAAAAAVKAAPKRQHAAKP